MVALERNPMTSHSRGRDTAVAALAVVTLVWIGALLGVSFLATPVKFLAPSLTLPVALDVGRQTFHWFNRAEIVLALATLAVALACDWPRRRDPGGPEGDTRSSVSRAPAYASIVAGFLLAAVLLQALWLLPQLDARVEVILQGGMPPPSSLHDIYVVVEAAKLGALVGGAWLAMASLRAVSGRRDRSAR